MQSTAINQKDGYKIGHKPFYPDLTEEIYGNLTARSGRLSNIKGTKGVYFVGLQALLAEYFVKEWNETFFQRPKEEVLEKYQRRVSNFFGYEIDISHIAALHDLGFLPIQVKAIPEGSFVPYGVPMVTYKNTVKNFGWVAQMCETVLSSETWQGITSATTYMEFKKLFTKFALKTGTHLAFVPYQGHDFSFRGMAGRHAAAKSGYAILACGSFGTDCLPAIDLAEDYYYADVTKEIVGLSITGTEHSVASANIITIEEAFRKTGEWGGLRFEDLIDDSSDTDYKNIAETAFIHRVISQVAPSGKVALVCDTYNFWNVVTNSLPILKGEIMARDGQVVIRPDSGDPVRMICGGDYEVIRHADNIEQAKRYALDSLEEYVREDAGHGECGMIDYGDIFNWNGKYYRAEAEFEWNRYGKQYYFIDGSKLLSFEEVELSADQKGLIECLWETFGGTLTETGHRMLDSHIGAIYGDSITYERATEILTRLEAKNFASGNIVLGLGSYLFQLVTRDTHGMAIKGTHIVVDGKDVPIFKDPITDDGTKKSAKGYMVVETDENGEYCMRDMVSRKEEKYGALRVVFRDGILYNETTLAETRKLTELKLS
jgi:nicotinamide phosphoribosyltransferase